MPFLILGILALIIMATREGVKLVQAYVNGKPANVLLDGIGGGFQLRSDAAYAFNLMRQAAALDGIRLDVNSAFRSMEEQQGLYELWIAKLGNLAAKPGFSNHQSGIAVDIDVDASFFSATYKWLAQYAGSFGFVNTGKNFSQSEPWHWEYVK